jgi:hypothetical protein
MGAATSPAGDSCRACRRSPSTAPAPWVKYQPARGRPESAPSAARKLADECEQARGDHDRYSGVKHLSKRHGVTLEYSRLTEKVALEGAARRRFTYRTSADKRRPPSSLRGKAFSPQTVRQRIGAPGEMCESDNFVGRLRSDARPEAMWSRPKVSAVRLRRLCFLCFQPRNPQLSIVVRSSDLQPVRVQRPFRAPRPAK